MILQYKNILIGITGGIAAYKICDLIRLLKKQGANVKVVMTPAAQEFVTETTLATLTQNPVYIDQFDVLDWRPEHISLADSSDLFIIAPASANTIGKLANGICDNLLTSLAIAFKKPIIIAPAMNSNMWDNQFVQKNLAKLERANFKIIEPETGFLACGYEGKGRMAHVQTIFEEVVDTIGDEPFLQDQHIIVTAGGTREDIDPVRYIGNYSSGKMGIAIADSAHQYGANVTLVSTVKVHKPYDVCYVKSAEEMLEVTKHEFERADALIMAAAVADYRIKQPSEQKIKKGNNDSLTLELVKNPDILKEISNLKTEHQTVIGFCAESENLIDNAIEKLKAKKLDYIIANDITKSDIGFDSDYNEVTVIDSAGKKELIIKATKQEVAQQILKKVFHGEGL